MTDVDDVAAEDSGTFRTSITMPADVAVFARSRSGGNLSGYLTSLVERERRRTTGLQRLAEHGYVGALAPTEEGRARARAVLDAHRARRRADGTGQRAA